MKGVVIVNVNAVPEFPFTILVLAIAIISLIVVSTKSGLRFTRKI